MAGRAPYDERDHERLVATAARHLSANGYRDIRADLEGWARPEGIASAAGGPVQVPDVTAAGVVGEVETHLSILDEHTEAQWKLFSSYCEQHGTRFLIFVPTGTDFVAKLRAIELGVDAVVVVLEE